MDGPALSDVVADRPSPWTRLGCAFELSDVAGVGVVVALGIWVLVLAGDGRGRMAPVLLLLAGLVVAVGVGRLVSMERHGLVARSVATAILSAFVVTWPGALGAGGGPTGYANSNATLAGLGVVAALQAAQEVIDRDARRTWVRIAVALSLVLVATRSVAGIGVVVAGLALVALAGILRWPGVAVVGTLIVTALVLAVTVAIGEGGDPFGLAGRDELRTELWQEAVALVDEAPLRGVGPGGFESRSTVRDDADLRWAHHGYLQVAAELGLGGLVLVLALLGWAWLRLWQTAKTSPAAASVASAALFLVAAHATVDWVWHVPVLLLTAALLFGAGTVQTPTQRANAA